MQPVKVSIVMPVYNAARYLPDTLVSLERQTTRCFELIAVDDGSSDCSGSLILDFAAGHPDIPVRYIRNAQNLGNYSTRNAGLRIAQGTYICMLDADDQYRDNYVERLLEEIERTGADMVFCGYDKVHDPGGKQERYESFKRYPPSRKKEVVLRYYLMGRTHIAHWATIFRKKFLEENQLSYTEGWHVAGDTELVCKALLACRRISFLEESLYLYRIHPNSITTSIPDETAFETYNAYLRVLHSIHNPLLKLFFLVTKQARATNIILMKFYTAGVKMPYFFCSKYKILLYQILNCLISKPRKAKILLRYYIDTYLKKER